MVLKVNRLEKIHSDVQNINNYAGQSYILSGLATTENTPNDMDVLVSAGEFVLNGAKVSCAGGNVTLTAASAGLYKYVIIRANSSGVLSAVEDLSLEDNTDDSVGSPALGVPDYDPDNYVAIARVLVGDVTAIVDANIKDLRKLNSDSTQIEKNTNNILINLKMNCDLALINTSNIDVMNTIDSKFKIVDLFTDSNGSNNTINTTNTTGKHIAAGSYYLLSSVVPTGVLEPGFETITNWTYSESGWSEQLPKISGDQNIDWQTEGTYSYRIRYYGTNITSGVSGEITQNVDFTYIKKLTVDCKFTKSGVGITARTVLVGSSSYSSSTIGENTVTHIDDSYGLSKNITLRLDSSDSEQGTFDTAAYFDNLLITPVGRIIESNAQTITGEYSFAFVRPKLYESLASESILTAQISLDNGVSWSSEFSVNEMVDISDLDNDGNMILRLIVNDNGTSEAKVSGLACLLW